MGRASYVRTPEQKAALSKLLTGRPKPWLKGRKRPKVGQKIAEWWTPERREKARVRGVAMAQDKDWLLRIAHALSGERNPMWQGGIANGQYAPGFCKTLKAKIRARDHHTCQLCGRTEAELGYRLSIHHSDYDKSNHAESNLFAVCKRCNSAVNVNRSVWQEYFRTVWEMRCKFSENVGDLTGR